MFQKIKKKISSRLRQKAISKIQFFFKIDGWLTQEEAFGLYRIAKIVSKRKLPVVVEIGSWKGKSTYCIAIGLNKGVINCIDPFNAAGELGSKEIYEKTKGEKSLLEQFNANLLSIPSGVIINPLQGYSKDFVGAIPRIDFLFIDGDHSIEGCSFDFEHYAKSIVKGGYLAFHDYDPNRIELGPTWVIEKMVKQDNTFRLIGTYDSLAVFKKTK